MTRLEAFAARLVEAVRDADGDHARDSDALAVAERLIREFIAEGADQYMGAAQMERYADEPADN